MSKKSKSGAVLCKERDSEENGVFREWIPTVMNKGVIQYHLLVVSRVLEGRLRNFIMNLCSALTACCFFDNKPEALSVHVEKSRQPELF